MKTGRSRVPSLGLVTVLSLAAAAGAVFPGQEAGPQRVLTAEIQDDQIIVRIDGATFTSYRFGPGQKMPYFYPVAGPLSGLSLTTESSLPYPHHRSLRIDEKGVVLKKGESLPLRYLVIVHAGNAVQAGIGDRYRVWKTEPVRLVTVDPGHFHAALVQKTRPFGVSPLVRVYAPAGPELNNHLARIREYNARPDDPTAWDERVYTGGDFFEKMIREEKPGAVVVLAGNNRKKTEYIAKALDAGFNVLADKPMAIDAAGYALLNKAFAAAEKKKLLLYDIMTERSEVTNALQKELIARDGLFGELAPGTPSDPAVVMASRHYFFKTVSGAPLVRPAWFFDPDQQGQGLTDVSTHLVDLVQWICFSGRIIRPEADLHILRAERRPAILTREQFRTITGCDDFPAYLKKYVRSGRLAVPFNGTILYIIKGIHARIGVEWGFEPPPGGEDSHFSVVRGTKASLIIRQEKEQNYRPELYVEAAPGVPAETVRPALVKTVADLQPAFPGIGIKEEKSGWRIEIPDRLRLGHEAHFGEVLRRFLRYLRDGRLPDWEGPNMLAKYWLTTTALSLSR